MRVRGRISVVAAVLPVAIAVAAFVIVRPAARPQRVGVAPTPPRLVDAAAAKANWLSAAETAYDRSHAWWDPQRGWYLKFLPSDGGHRVVTLWHVVHLFSAVDAIAIADPSPAPVAAARSFADAAEKYWNPNLRPVPGYGPLPNDTRANARAWYDDDAWWGVAFFDAFRATGDRRYLRDADRALTFVNSGWDPRSGGIYWDVHRTFKSSESLAGATLTAASLYGQTHDPRYLALARRYIAWADRTIRGSDGLYGARSTPARPMPYVEGPMAEAMLRLCHSTGRQSWCNSGEALMRRTAARFPTLTMGPQYDAIYIRALLEIYRMDHNPRWYAIAQRTGNEVLANAGAPGGLLLRTWQGQATRPPGRLQVQGASTSVLAWLAAAHPVKGAGG